MAELRKLFPLFLCVIITSLLFVNCSNDDSTDEKSSEDLSVLFPLEGGMQDLYLPANQSVNYMLTLQVPPEIKKVESATIDVKESLKNASVTIQGTSLKAALLGAVLQSNETGSILIRVGDTPETACASSITYGPFNLAVGFFGSPDPQEISLDQPSIQIVNRGTVVLCLEMQSSVDAMVSVGDVAVDVTQTECPEAVDFSGTWQGTYECGNSCDTNFGGSIQLKVSQNGTSATYVDQGEDMYTGTVCGDVFRFKRNDPDEVESGTLTLIGPDRAVKHSTWRSVFDPSCYGDCVDSLYRVAN